MPERAVDTAPDAGALPDGSTIGPTIGPAVPLTDGVTVGPTDGTPVDGVADRTAPSVRRRLRVTTAVLLVAVGLALVGWMLATPLMAVPDEPSHLTQAVAIVHGQFDVRHVRSPAGQVSYVRVPAWVLQLHLLINCYAFKPMHPADCPVVVTHDQTPYTLPTQFSNYPPLFFLWAGLPSLVLSGTGAAYAMRSLALLLNAGLLVLGLALLLRYHPRRLPLVGALVALTPMVLFLASVLNTSGLETSAAFAAWCGGLCLVARDDVPVRLAVWTSLAFVLFIWSRPISPVNAGIVLVVLAVLAGRSRLRALAASTGARLLAAAVVVAVAVAGVLAVVGGTPQLLGTRTVPPLSFGAAFHEVLTLDPSRLQQAIGLFGWTDTPIPTWVTVAWTTAKTPIDLPRVVSVSAAASMAPTITIAEMALVTAISGVCKAGVTVHTTW